MLHRVKRIAGICHSRKMSREEREGNEGGKFLRKLYSLRVDVHALARDLDKLKLELQRAIVNRNIFIVIR
jgi:hypothetical protein